MKTPIRRPVGATESSTRDNLVEAAAREFNSVGYHGTNTNKIAREAGYSPQTFYRHFDDKIDIFLATYDAWQTSERHAIARAMKSSASDRSVAKIILDHHVEWRIFRGSLRLLAVEEPRVRRARAASRERQVEILMRLPENEKRERVELIAGLLTIERLCDAVADGEFEDLGIPRDDVLAPIAAALRNVQG
ncbi:TetR/AcrR family transcriptional regulator [Bradyrhizobium diazoefficiens]|nr:TetR/AcrR family transcriptional regulator [Bradyrhizobium diazoefficiens]MBR0849484.1 TetR/AcrR family transcriptional regulator [Bradyrhizobium diazoefficiens]